jgi:hypothetical protein
MPGNPREMITMAERRFPVRVRLAVPPGGRKEILRGKSRDHDTGETYYRHWLAAIERVVVEKGCHRARGACALSRRLGSRRQTHAPRRTDRSPAQGFRPVGTSMA